MKKCFSLLSVFCVLAFVQLALVSPAQAQEFKLDTVHTAVYFRIGHFNGTSLTYGRFNDVQGSFATGEKASFNFTVKTESVDTGNPKRDEHLRNADFFNAKQYPVITLKSKSVKVEGDVYTVEADLTLLSTTKPITLKLNKGTEGPDFVKGQVRTGFSTEFTIKRSDFGMSNMIGPAGDEVTLFVSFEGTRAQ